MGYHIGIMSVVLFRKKYAYPERHRHDKVAGGTRARERDCQGVEAPWPLTLTHKYTQQRDQEPEYARIKSIIQGDEVGSQWRRREPAMETPPRGLQVIGNLPRESNGEGGKDSR